MAYLDLTRLELECGAACVPIWGGLTGEGSTSWLTSGGRQNSAPDSCRPKDPGCLTAVALSCSHMGHPLTSSKSVRRFLE